MRTMNSTTPEGSLVRNTTTGKVMTVVMDYPHKKVIATPKGTHIHVTPEFYHNWVEVLPDFELSTFKSNSNGEVLH
jgi:hypothetical protein